MTTTYGVETKQAVEFGKTVTLYRVYDPITGKGTLWHSSQERAWKHFERLIGLRHGVA